MAVKMGREMAEPDREKSPTERTPEAAQRSRDRTDDKSEARSGIYRAAAVLSGVERARVQAKLRRNEAFHTEALRNERAGKIGE